MSKTDEANPGTGLDPNQLKYVQALEQSYVKRIEAILIPIVGQENVRAQVAADVDFAHSEQMDETLQAQPGRRKVPRSAVSRRRNRRLPAKARAACRARFPISLRFRQPPRLPQPRPHRPIRRRYLAHPAHRPGRRRAAVPTVPPPPINTRKDATINYEVDKTIQHVRKPVGGIKRLSVAVVVNHRKVTDEKGIISTQTAERSGKIADHRSGERGHGIQQGARRYPERGQQPFHGYGEGNQRRSFPYGSSRR